MQAIQFVARSTVGLALAGALVACDKSPIAPTPAPGGGPVPPGPAVLSTLDVTGPLTVGIGESVQFKAMGRYSDGSLRDVTTQASWRVGNPAVLSFSTPGLATGHESGETGVGATLGSSFGSQGGVIVVPPGTFRLSGNIRDDKAQVTGAQVTVSMASGQAHATTVGNGFFQIYGVAGDTEIRIVRPGYEEFKQRWLISSHQWLTFDMVLARPRDQIAGTYTLRIRAADECRASLPDGVLDRTYTAVLQQDGSQVLATLTGATFVTAGGRTMNTFAGSVVADEARFFLSSEYSETFPFPMVAEETGPSTYVAVSGEVSTASSGSRRSGLLNGTIVTFEGRHHTGGLRHAPRAAIDSSCRNDDVVFRWL